MIRKALIASAAALAALAGLTLASAGAASAPAATYSQNGTYQFASNTGRDGDFYIAGTQLAYSDASESLTANGVSLWASGSDGESAAVIVPLGRLRDLFNGNGQYVAPVITGSGDLQYNLYFDTSASGTYLGYPMSGASDPFLFSAWGGSNAASMGSALSPADTPDFGTWSSQPATVPGLLAATTMEQVKAAFAGNPDGDTNPLVFAWIGENAGTDGTSAHAVVTSVDGNDLVTVTTPPPPPVITPDSVTVTYACGTKQADYQWNVTVAGSTAAKVNLVTLNGTPPKTQWLWDGSSVVGPSVTKTVATSEGYRLGAYWDADGSQPAPHESGALFTQAAAPAAADRVAC